MVSRGSPQIVRFLPRYVEGPPRTKASEKLVAFFNREDIATVERLYTQALDLPAIRDEADSVLEAYEQLTCGK